MGNMIRHDKDEEEGGRAKSHSTVIEPKKANLVVYINGILTVATLGYCFYGILGQEAPVAIAYSRYLAGMATLCMLVSIFVMYYCNIRLWREDRHVLVPAPHVSKTVIMFIITMATVTTAGYVKLVATDVVLWNYDFALDYTEPYEVYFDITYSFVFVYLFLPTLLVYTILYAPSYRTNRITTNLLIFTLVLCFLQKWAYETLTIDEHICQAMFEEDGRQCGNRNGTHFATSYLNLTGRQRHLYDSMMNESPYIYTCTMELLPAIGALLVSIIRHKQDKAESKEFTDVPTSTGWKTYALLICTVLFYLIALVGQPLLSMAYDKRDIINWALLGYGLYRLFEHSLGLALFSIVYYKYKQPEQPRLQLPVTEERLRLLENEHIDVIERVDIVQSPAPAPTRIICCSSFRHWMVSQTKEMEVIIDIPDLFIMVISSLLTFILQTLKFIVHLCAYVWYYTQDPIFPSLTEIFVHDVASSIQILSFLFQYRAIKTFLTFNHDSMERLRKQKFVVHLAPAALAINVFRFGGIYLSNGNFLPPYPTQSFIYDNILSMLDSAYPFSLLFSMTAALCWAHIIERLHKAGAYKVVPEEAGVVQH